MLAAVLGAFLLPVVVEAHAMAVVLQEDASAQPPQQPRLPFNAKSILGKDAEGVAAELGSPVEEETIRGLGQDLPRKYYLDGQVEVTFINGVVDWISVHPDSSYSYLPSALRIVGLSPGSPSFRNEHVIRWKGHEGLAEVSMFPGAERDKVSRITIYATHLPGEGRVHVGYIANSVLHASEQPPNSNEECWKKAGGNLWAGVMLYYGPSRMVVGTVLGGNERYRSPSGDTFRGLKIRYPSGSEEWKDRNAVNLGPWYIRCDDPALARMEWYTIQR